MATGPAIRYVQYYTDGSAARKAQPTVQLQMELKPKAKKRKKILVRIDPVATLGILVAAVMLIMMISGIFQLRAIQEQSRQMETYVQQLQEENVQVHAEYAAGYDMEEVEKMALALGMVPADQVKQVEITLSAPRSPESEPISLWDSINAFFVGLIA